LTKYRPKAAPFQAVTKFCHSIPDGNHCGAAVKISSLRFREVTTSQYIGIKTIVAPRITISPEARRRIIG